MSSKVANISRWTHPKFKLHYYMSKFIYLFIGLFILWLIKIAWLQKLVLDFEKKRLSLCFLSLTGSNLVFRLFIPRQTVIVYAAAIVAYLLFLIPFSYFNFFSGVVKWTNMVFLFSLDLPKDVLENIREFPGRNTQTFEKSE